MSFRKALKYGIRLVLALTVGLALVGFLPIPAHAQGPVIDLELDGERATSWNISNIKPGDSGTKTVELHNAGSRKGSVTIWISDIEEVDYAGDGAVLDDYLVFNLSCDWLSTNMTFPSLIRELPQSASDTNYVEIGRLNHGQTITLTWHWEFLELGEAQNDGQGDSLSFTINYLLEELPPDDGGRDDSEPSYRILKVDILGKVTKCKVSCSGKLLYSYVAAGPDNKRKLELDKRTKLTCANGELPRRIEMKVYEEALPTPEGMQLVSPVYDLTGCVYGDVSCRVTFDPEAKLTLSYDPSRLPRNTSSLTIAAYYPEQGWRELEAPSGSPDELGETTALISHTSTFAILAKLEPLLSHPQPPPSPPPLSAHFVASDLNIILTEEKIWEPITFVTKTGESLAVTTNIANDGGQQGTYIAELEIDGEIVNTEELILAAGQSQQVSFALSGLDYGQHKVELAGLSREFTVWRTINWWLIMGMIVAVGSIIWGVTWGIRKNKTI